MKILLYILLVYVVLTEIFGICLSVSFYRDHKKRNESTRDADVIAPLFMPILPILFAVILVFQKFGIELAPMIKHILRTDRNTSKSVYDPMNDPIFEPHVNTIGFKELPFIPDPSQVIYVENHYTAELNDKIIVNYDEICEWFHENGLQFVYLPIETSSEIMRQRIMAISPEKVDDVIYPDALKSDYLLDYMIRQENKEKINPCLIWLKGIEDGETVFHMMRIPKHNNMVYVFKVLGNSIEKRVTGVDVRYRIVDDDKSEEELDAELQDAIEAFKKSAERLAACGITQMVLHDILTEIEPISRMVISPDNKIFLTDYDNVEIKMTAIAQALYFLFLRYPEGIILKTLPDYYKELLNIYKELKPNFKEDGLEKSIKDLVDPQSNSINEKISAIRSAFTCKIDAHQAKNYYISGSAGNPYKILLDRNLIEWKED